MVRAETLHGAALTPREALVFEAGVKLGGVFHQYLGVPVGPRSAATLARAIEAAVGLQPYVRAVRVRIAPERAGPLGRPPFDYRYLTAEMLDVEVELRDGPTCVRARLAYRPDLRYPLMRVESIVRPGPARSAGRSARRGGRSARRTGRSAGSGAGPRTPRGRARSSRRRGLRQRSA